MSDPQPSPTPATPLNYSHAASYHGRPGILTAVGVMSIVIACLSGLSSLWGTASAGMYFMMSRQPPSALAPAAPTPAPTTATTTTAAAGGTMIVHSHSVTFSSVGGVAVATTAPTTTPAPGVAPPAMGNPFSGINPLAAILSAIAELLSFALAVLLLVAAIQILRDAPSGPKLHRWYALAKIPLVIFATAVSLWLTIGMMQSIMASMPPAAGGAAGPQSAFMWSFMAARTILPALLALAYPVALLIILRSRTVREYYNAVRDADGVPPPVSFDSPAG
jgi:hypothetical protein